MIEAVIIAYFVIIALAQIICDFTLWGYNLWNGAKSWWESGNPLLGILAIPGFILGGLFLGLAFLLPVAVIGIPLIMGIWAVFCLIRG